MLCSYPICIAPANGAIEIWLVNKLKHRPERLYWAQNYSRFMVTALATVLAVCLASKIDKFLGLIGSFLCAPLALFFPALLHLRLLAKTRGQKAVDLGIIAISAGVFIFCST